MPLPSAQSPKGPCGTGQGSRQVQAPPRPVQGEAPAKTLFQDECGRIDRVGERLRLFRTAAATDEELERLSQVAHMLSLHDPGSRIETFALSATS